VSAFGIDRQSGETKARMRKTNAVRVDGKEDVVIRRDVTIAKHEKLFFFGISRDETKRNET
jgi:hypothetical protein